MFLSLLLPLLISISPARAAVSPVWSCASVIDAAGDQKHFWIYGRDSWSGRAEMICFAGPERLKSEIDVTFNSMEAGFGAGEDSRLVINMTLNTLIMPEFLQVRSLVAGISDAGNLVWNVLDTLSETRARVYGFGPDAVASLKYGTLYVRAASKTENAE